jgi:uncharacterized membrane protein YjjP (DUF1212 family)
VSVAPGGRQPDDNRATLILGELGALLLEAGLSVTDVRTSLETVRDSSAIDGDDLSFSVLPEMVIVTQTRTGAATVVSATTSDLSFRQAAQASQLVRHVQAGVTSLSDVPAQVAQIRGLVRSHAGLQWIVGSALLSSGLAILFRCSWWAIVVTAVVGALVGVITTVLNRIQGAVAIVPFVATLTAATLVGALAHGAGLTQVPMFAVCAPIAIIVPGALITNALLELTARDIITGSARLLYGLIMLGFMTAGIAAGAALTGLRIDPNSAALVGEAAAANSVTGGWQALPPLWLSWVGVVILATGIGLAFGSGARLTVLNVIVMTGTYALLATLTPITGSIVATGHGRYAVDRSPTHRQTHVRRTRHCVIPTGLPAPGSGDSGAGGTGFVTWQHAGRRDGHVYQSVHRNQSRCSRHRDLVCDPKATVAISPSRIGTRGSADVDSAVSADNKPIACTSNREAAETMPRPDAGRLVAGPRQDRPVRGVRADPR